MIFRSRKSHSEQIPEAEKKREVGSAVTLYISTGKEKTELDRLYWPEIIEQITKFLKIWISNR